MSDVQQKTTNDPIVSGPITPIVGFRFNLFSILVMLGFTALTVVLFILGNYFTQWLRS